MFLVADSGSTKTEWLLAAGKKKVRIRTAGINPFFLSAKDILQLLDKEFPKKYKKIIGQQSGLTLYFYGAGCSTPRNRSIVRKALGSFFGTPARQIHIEHDLLGAARALFGGRQGIAVILGTGSNSCLYNGKSIVKNIPALGYVLGDEGSAAHMGKTLLRSYLYGELPGDLSKSLQRLYRPGKKNLLQQLYGSPRPNTFLAGFAPFLSLHSRHPAIRAFIRQCFREFFTHHASRYQEHRRLPVGCVGSVAHHFEAILRSTAGEFGMRIEKILQHPIDSLAAYHALNGKK